MNNYIYLLCFLFLPNLLSFVYSQQDLNVVIPTIYETKDWVISDYIVTKKEFGAQATPGFDNREAFQAAIDAAHKNGGGVVYVPAGNYEFHSSKTGTKNVRIREGSKDNFKDFNYEYVLQIPQSVQLRGDWANPELHNGKVLGTILEVHVGKNSSNHNGTVESWWNDPQANNVLQATYTSIADRFIEMQEGTGVTNVSIWYPHQDINDVTPYPWTLFQANGNSATVENVTLVNSYNGFYSAPSELHYILNSYITALNTGLEVHVCTDIGRIENVKINPKFWAESGLPGSPALKKVTDYTRDNGTGFNMHRSDWEYVSYLEITGYKTGMWIGREPGFTDAPNAQFYEINIENCGIGLYIQDVNPYGLLFSNSTFGADKNGLAVYFQDYFSSSVQFNGVNFNGSIVSDGSGGVISFENCNFDKYDEFALKLNSGNLLLTQCEFMQPYGHVILNEKVNSIKSMNSGFETNLNIINKNNGPIIEVLVDEEYQFTPIPKNIITNIVSHPKPKSNRVLRLNAPKEVGFNNRVPKTDISHILQKELNSLAVVGGGTLFMPSGRYLVNNPIVIPSGVELRGSWDVQHHTQSGGTSLFTNYTGGKKGEDGESLIQIKTNAGISGLKIVQHNIVTDGYSVSNPRKTPFLIQGQGENVYIVNITIPVADKGIDLATFNTSGHYVNYFAGVLARAGIWVGGGAEGGFIRNMQFNPHYGTRHPKGGQGYPNVALGRFVQSNCSALKFADVKNQTIFNNFVYGSVYGIHFLKDEITENYPGEITVVGHGSDGCTYALYVEDADDKTNIIAINSELVNTKIQSQPVRAYVLMGGEINTDKVHLDAKLTLYNSAFWGSPTIGAIINNGTVRFQQANFQNTGTPCIDVRGGKAHIYSSYFAQKMSGPITGDNVYGRLHQTASSIELINNFYKSGIRVKQLTH